MKVLIWFKAYDLMYMYANEEQKKHFDNIVNSAEILFVPDDSGDSYKSACERIYDDHVLILPPDVDNTEDAKAFIADKLLFGPDDGHKYEILGPEDLKKELLGEEIDANPINFAQMNNVKKGLQEMSEEEMEEQIERMPGRIGEQLKGLMGAIEEVNDNASGIFARYCEEAANQGISKEQAKEEAEQYMKGEIPAAEFIAPVAILDNLKEI